MELTAKMIREAADAALDEPYRPLVPVLTPNQYAFLKAEQRAGESEIEVYYRLCAEAVRDGAQ